MQTKFILIGDSNSGAIGKAAKAAELPFIGGPIATGKRLDSLFFDIDENNIARFHDDIPKNLPYTAEQALDPSTPVLTTLGFNTQRIGQFMGRYIKTQKITLANLSESVLDQGIEDYKAGPLAYYREAVKRGVPVYASLSPQRFPELYFETAIEVERRFSEKLREIGVQIVDVRQETTDGNGRLLPEYFTEREGDNTHSNALWGKVVIDRFLEQSGI